MGERKIVATAWLGLAVFVAATYGISELVLAGHWKCSFGAVFVLAAVMAAIFPTPSAPTRG